MSRSGKICLLAGAALSLLSLAAAVKAESVEQVLAFKQAPAGVVFEIISSDRNHLEQAIPTVNRHIETLRQRFPGLAITIVSHGDEQFALTAGNRDRHKEAFNQVASLVADKNTTFHVCGTYARMNNVDETEFPDFVDVAPHGPIQIRDYVELGYIKIVID